MDDQIVNKPTDLPFVENNKTLKTTSTKITNKFIIKISEYFRSYSLSLLNLIQSKENMVFFSLVGRKLNNSKANVCNKNIPKENTDNKKETLSISEFDVLDNSLL